ELASGEYRDLLTRWEEGQSRGDPVSLADLCAGRPETVPTVAELIRLVEDARARLTRCDVGSTCPDGREAPAARLPHVPGYQLLDVLGRGGMGIVYKARQLGFNRLVALKMIRAGAGGEPGDFARFRIEAEAVARLRHPNIVQVFDIGEVDGCPYFSMEHLGGGSLARRAQAERLPPRRAAEVVEALAQAMQHAHEAGVVHRDLKPSNVLLDADGTPKVADFGLARLLDADITRTASEVILGTACYMAPEQTGGGSRDAGPAADVYGLGAILYDLLTGRPPIERGSWATMLERVRTQEPIDPCRLRPEVGRDLEAVCLKCLRKDPARRYASARELADDLRRFLDGKPTAARPLNWAGRLGRFVRRRPLAGVAAVLLILAAVAVPVAAYYLDPQRVPKDCLHELEHGRSVTLLGATGPPRWRRPLIGEVNVVDSPAHDDTFSVSTLHDAYVELLPAGRARGYRFRIRVRHERSEGAGEVGIYFAHSHFETGAGVEHCFCALSFSEGEGNHTPQPSLDLRVRRRRPPGRFLVQTWGEITAPVVPLPADLPAAERWRELRIDVSRQCVRVFSQGDLVGEVLSGRLIELFQEDLNSPHDRFYEPSLSPSLAAAGGIGIFISDGWASFRDAVIEPLDD
ncbi:MAG TPA: serine/threonine-protein kinase, partial [Gemmataceae bacterium]|nr:serine/threonine-protein kinase [Gemmataceae bacterium]